MKYKNGETSPHGEETPKTNNFNGKVTDFSANMQASAQSTIGCSKDTVNKSFETKRPEIQNKQVRGQFLMPELTGQNERGKGTMEASGKLIKFPTLTREEARPLIFDPIERPLWETDDRVLNPYEELPPVLTWGNIGERQAIERQGIITFSAKPKQGKSLSVYALVTSIISGKQFDTFRPTSDRPRLVMVFDTEMNKPTLQHRARNIYKAIGDDRNRFMIIPLLSVKKSERRAVIEDITSKYNPDIVAMDVVTKLVDDFNDAKENSEFGDWLEKYAADRTVMVVIHQNKASDDFSMKGHLGSILGEAAVENYRVSRKNGIFEIKVVSARNSCVEESPSVLFAVDSEGMVISAVDVMGKKRQETAELWKNDLRPIFGEEKTLSYKDLRSRIMDKQQLSKSAAEKKISSAKECEAIVKVGDKKNSPYKLA